MADADSSVVMERICPECATSNPPGAGKCRHCGRGIVFVPDTPVCEAGGGIDEEVGCQTGETTAAQESRGGTCPDCGAEGTYINNRCLNCDDSSCGTAYRINWLDERIDSIVINPGKPVFIGRVPPVEAELARQIETCHQTVSRMHAELYFGSDGALYLRDMGSQNGTCINGQGIQKFEPHELKRGDKLSFSSSLCAVVGLI